MLLYKRWKDKKSININITLILAKFYHMNATHKTALYIAFSGALLLGVFLAQPVQALDSSIRQVKTPNNPAVYYLNHNNQLKKAYVNEAAYLSYGNKWSEVKLISPEELAKWSDALLVKTATGSDIYYLKGKQKALIATSSDLISLGLVKEPILPISQIDLDQYSSVSYSDLGLVTNTNFLDLNNINILSPQASSTLAITWDQVSNPNNNNILAGTNSNLVGVLNLQAGTKDVTLRTLKIDLTGVYNSGLVDKLYITLEDYKILDRYSHFSNRQLEVNFPNDPYIIPAGQTRTIRVWLNLKACTLDCTNQTVRTEIKSMSNINSDAVITSTLPLTSTYLKILSVPSLLGQPVLQEQSLNTTLNGQNLILGKFTLTEDSGHEDIYLKELSFLNSGTASLRDLDTFRLQSGGNIISRTSTMTDGNRIIFKVNYARVSQGSPIILTVFGQKTGDFTSGRTINLNIDSAWITGKNIGVSLTSTIDNLEESRVIN